MLNKLTIPSVKSCEPLITAIAGDEYWKQVSVVALHDHRLALRELIKFIDRQAKPILYTDIKDEFTGNIAEAEFPLGKTSLEPYRKRIEKFIKEHETHITIHRLKNNLPITKSELAELEKLLLSMDENMSKELLERTLGGQPLGQFVRSIIGLDVKAAKEAFSEFLTTIPLTADQQTFINKLIDFLVVKGVVDAAGLFEVPFTDI